MCVSPEQDKKIRGWIAAHNIHCPMCGAKANELQIYGTSSKGLLPRPDGSHQGRTIGAVYLACVKCAYVILLDCDTMKLPYYHF
jgi:hypothetical protein